MATIGLILHGITEWNSLGKAQGVSDIPLNEIAENKLQALGIDYLLKNSGI
ncbi:histidine phosphatase family protein [Rossellomorea sp. y25]|uniref:histidine phosphatase family protein n=1 Tax=Rossellomorea sp. y25 TaxID=3118174 RepID=UPI0030E0656C